jgi:hypothetical protein
MPWPRQLRRHPAIAAEAEAHDIRHMARHRVVMTILNGLRRGWLTWRDRSARIKELPHPDGVG